MLNSLLNGKISQQVISDIKALVYKTQRNYIDPCKHYEPHDISWQWMPREGPEEKCKHRCVSRKCPKKRFFPRFKKQYVPKDMCAEKKKDDRMTWKEYFSYLLPDHMQAEFIKKRPKLVECRNLAAMRRMKCADAYDMECCRDGSKSFKEWYDQGVIHLLEGGGEYESQLQARCVPRDRGIPRCVLPRHGACHTKELKKDSDYGLPYQAPPGRDPPQAPMGYTFRKKKCYSIVPPRDKRLKLSCRNYGDFKMVECPAPLYAKFRTKTRPCPPYVSVLPACPPPIRECDTSCNKPCVRPFSTASGTVLLGPRVRSGSSASLGTISRFSSSKDPSVKCPPGGCSACEGVAKKTPGDMLRDCKVKSCKCPPPKNRKHPDCKISNPYWDGKSKARKICNKNPDEDLRDFHTSSPLGAKCPTAQPPKQSSSPPPAKPSDNTKQDCLPKKKKMGFLCALSTALGIGCGKKCPCKKKCG